MATAVVTPAPPSLAVDDGLGEPMDPVLGNRGYDVTHYDLDLEYGPALADSAGDGELHAEVTLSATATTLLDTFNVDFIGFDVDEVTLDGEQAVYARTERDMTVKPAQPLAAGRAFTLSIRYSGTPQTFTSTSGMFIPLGWHTVPGGSYVVSDPDGARAWFPCNDHPTDKATYSFSITVPDPLVAAANGVLMDRIPADGRTSWIWQMNQPMASYLATVIIGEYDIVDDPHASEVSGVPVRNVLPRDALQLLDSHAIDAISRQGDMINFLADLFGPYPFDTYGIALVPAARGALETQTLSVIGPVLEGVLVHELAHQWVGDHVSVSSWRDVWLKEGFATYASWLWQDHRGEATLEELVAFERSAHLPPPGDPTPGDLYSRSVYGRGALTLHALRVLIGDDEFRDVLREWMKRFGGKSGSTQDFIAIAEEISSRDLAPFFDGWLHQPAMPTIPADE